MSSTTPPPGWYPDPQAPGSQRYWDGSAWTGHLAPIAGMAPGVAAPPEGISPKSYMTAWLLSLFLGGLGVDRFYLGNIGLGVAKLLLNWATGGIWSLIDFIVIVTKSAHDGDGRRVMVG